MTHPAENHAPFVERVSERHFPWWYTEFGTMCCCGRPVRLGDDCDVMLRARRWERPIPPASTDGAS